MTSLFYKYLVTEELSSGAILNEEYQGFKEDYLVLHCLLKIFGIKSVFEIGTNMGTGTMIMKNAMGHDSVVYSLDLPTELAHISLHPVNEGEADRVGSRCSLPFIQIRGDSLQFDYEPYKGIEAFFIDGEHDYQHSNHEAKVAISCQARLIIFHDSDMEDVYKGIADAFEGNKTYELYRVEDTRIAYAVRKGSFE